MFMSMTGTSLHDLPRRRVGKEMWERARNPKGDAMDETTEMNAWDLSKLAADWSAVRFRSSGLCPLVPFVAVGRPTTARHDTPGRRLVMARKRREERVEKRD